MTLLPKPIYTTLSTLALVAVLGLPAVAQETATEDAETATQAPVADAEAPATEAESGFDMGEEVDENGDPVAPEPQEPQPGQQYLAEVFGDWALRCLKTEEGDDPCQMYQLMNDEQDNSVAEIAIVPLAAGGQAVAGATIVVPLETLLTEQITLRVDGGTARRFPFSFCNQGGCVSRIGLTEQDVNLFRRGASASVSMTPAAAPDQTVTVTMSLSGFTAAYDASRP